MGVLVFSGRSGDFAGGKMRHQEEKKGVSGYMKVEIDEAVY